MRWLWIGCFLLLRTALNAQELFPLSEPANTLPAGVLGLRLYSDGNYEIRTLKWMAGARLMYGVTSRLSLYLSGTASNHHSKKLPPDLVSHTHPSGGSPYYFTRQVLRGQVYPMNWNGFHLMAKYRFLNLDGKNSHLRMALIAEGSLVKQAHDEAEPNLLHDNRGWGAGLIVSLLQNRFAASMTLAGILPSDYIEQSPDQITGSPVERRMSYGNGLRYSLSLGYLVQGNRTNDYDEPSTSLYLELIGSSWGDAKFVYDGRSIPTENPAFKAGYYLEIHPGIQRVIGSNLRMELSVGFPLFHRSWVHYYPMYSLGIQRFFY